ncbi:MAG: hypothetical protein P0Y56_01385 [Candidatus Andeanibacterium colombiense]|uniref:Uncharacterized protein n=1 Tax=Candidatus Andeanibacterium colombiense TaxID=3121345 RepID=A0AAJ5X774_9SPHN|nr:MAG: hypothetical protein P0Y56_01385 [Sphingomonadaceae bacterium]
MGFTPRFMLKVFASLVIGFFTLLWVTGNSPASLRHGIMHWADGNSSANGTAIGGDWGD